MKFSEVVAQTVAWLQREGRVSYRALKREFELDDEFLADVKTEIIEAKRLAVDENGTVLVWVGNSNLESRVQSLESAGQGRASTVQTLDSRRQTLDSAAERRQLTVMFCDLVGSTALSTQLDPEELREVMQAYQQACVAVISRFEGYVSQYLGDGLLVYFGYPAAHEDDAARAARAGLGIIAAIKALSLPPHLHLPHPLQVRVGIHTGLVVIGEIGSGEYRAAHAIVGETPNIAARVQDKALPNSVVISPTTYHLVTGLFECQELGPQELKGLSTPLSLYRIVQESEARDRFEVAVKTGLTPLVGREEELELLCERWTQAKAGVGQAVLLQGEAGIGKSRLVQALKEQVVQEGAMHLEFRCSPYFQNSALSPIIERLQRLLRFRRDESPEEKSTKLAEMLASYRFPQTDTVALMAALLSLPYPDKTTPLTLSPQKQKQKTYEVLGAWFGEEAERGPVYCVWEDLHWADPSTLEVFSLLLERLPAMRLLTVFTCRPEFHPPWKRNPAITSLMLNRLAQSQVKEMTQKVAGGKALPAEVVQQIVAKTDGVPLFVEELTKMVVESDLLTERDTHYELRGALLPLAIPSTLHDSLMARLDRLTTAREVAQVGATLGREFSYDLIQAVVPLREDPLQQALSQLVAAELMYQKGLPPQATYVFKHALVQDTAYQSLLKSKRQQLHQRIAQVLEVQFPDIVETQPELVAHHYTEAKLNDLAVRYWDQAGQGAIRRAAFTEGLNHLTRGLALLQTLPESPERDRQELGLQSALGLVLQTLKGYAAPEVDQAYTRARKLCQQVRDTAQLVSVLRGQLLFYGVRADYEIALKLGRQMLAVADQNPEYLVEAHLAMGLISLYLGEFHSSRIHLERGIAIDTPQGQPLQAFQYVGHSRAMCFSYLGRTLWLLGYPDQALQRSQEGLSLAQTLTMPMTLAQAQGMHTLLYQVRREVELTQAWAEKTIAYATEHGFPYWLTLCAMSKGWTLAQQGQSGIGGAQFSQGLAGYRSTGAKLGLSWLLALSAELAGKTGQNEEGLQIMAEALTLVNQTGERYYEAELHRLKGKIMLQQESQKSKIKSQKKLSVISSQLSVPSPQPLTPSTQVEAEVCFLKAIDIARKQQAKSWELRAVMSLSRLWQQQGKGKEAHTMLSAIYGWFTEGFATPDLQDAKALLEQLA